MATINIKVANENKQNSVIQGQEEIKTKLKTSRIKSSQSGYVNRTTEILTQKQKEYGYEFLISRINPVNTSKCELSYNTNAASGATYLGKSNFPLVYGYRGSTGEISSVKEAFNLQLKSDGVYATPVTQSITETTYYFLAGISWQVIEFY